MLENIMRIACRFGHTYEPNYCRRLYKNKHMLSTIIMFICRNLEKGGRDPAAIFFKGRWGGGGGGATTY